MYVSTKAMRQEVSGLTVSECVWHIAAGSSRRFRSDNDRVQWMIQPALGPPAMNGPR